MAKNETKAPEVTVNASTFRGSVYSQLVGVTITDIDVTLEFVYVNPRDKTQGEVVSRVTIPRQTGQELAKVIRDTVAQHEEKKRGEN